MLETSSRLLALLSLLQSRPDWPGRELAERLGVSTRTIRNDIERLRELGYPVEAGRGPTGAYRLGPGAEPPPTSLPRRSRRPRLPPAASSSSPTAWSTGGAAGTSSDATRRTPHGPPTAPTGRPRSARPAASSRPSPSPTRTTRPSSCATSP